MRPQFLPERQAKKFSKLKREKWRLAIRRLLSKVLPPKLFRGGS